MDPVAERDYAVTRILRSFAVIMDREKSSSDWDKSLRIISELPVYETPSAWERIITDSSFQQELRQRCLDHLISRHIRPGCSLDRFKELVEFSKWISEANVYGTITLSAAPLQIRSADPVFAIAVVRNHRAISPAYVRVNKRISAAAFLAILRGELSNYGDFRITEVWTSIGNQPRWK